MKTEAVNQSKISGYLNAVKEEEMFEDVLLLQFSKNDDQRAYYLQKTNYFFREPIERQSLEITDNP